MLAMTAIVSTSFGTILSSYSLAWTKFLEIILLKVEFILKLILCGRSYKLISVNTTWIDNLEALS